MTNLIFFFIFAAGSGSDWPAFRGPNHNGIAPTADVFQQGFGLKTSWERELGSAYSGICIVGDTAVTMFSDGKHDYLMALAVNDGTERWRFTISDTFKGRDGSHDGPLSTPLIDEGLVYGISPLGRLFAVALADGKLVWERHLVDDFSTEELTYGFSASPIVAGDVLVVVTGGTEAPASLTGVNKKTGKNLWTAGKARTTYQSPIYANFMGKQQLILSAYDSLLGVDPKDGKLLWEYEHGGRNHGGQPVLVGTDRIYVETLHDEGVLLSASRVDGAIQFEKLWASKELTSNFNVPVYYEGHLYGFGGRFLTCVDIKTGKRVWRSRPPGAGFGILVDGHLAVYTRKGSLHLIEATPSGYVEKSSIEVLPGDHLTAPGFANNKIFLRNLKGIAAVDVGRPDVTQLAGEKATGMLPNSAFAKRMAALAEASDKRTAVDAFMKDQSQFPIREGERMVHIVYRGEAEDVALKGQMVEDLQTMNRVPGTDLYYYSLELEAGARCYYQLSVNFATTTDPLNKETGPAFYGDELHSVLTVNSWQDGDHLSEPKKPGKLEELKFQSEHTKSERKAQVFLPASYADSTKRYPLLYIAQGSAAIEKGLMVNTLSNLIAAGHMEEVIAVFVETDEKLGYREANPGNAENYAVMLREELVPLVDKTWRTRAKAEDRALMGHYDMSNNILLAALDGKRTFSRAVTQTAEVDDDWRKKFMGLERLNDVSIRLEWGTYSPQYDDRVDVPTWNRKLVEALKQRGVKIEGHQQPIGHGWANWRTRHDDILKLLFPPRGS